MPILELESIHKRFGAGPAVLRGIDLSVKEGEIACLLGPSGCGKTTLLRIIAGLETPDRGTVRYRQRDIGSVPVHERGFGLMFQNYALFPHLDVAANVAFGLRMQGRSPAQAKERVGEVLSLVSLAELAARDVGQLSGGEQQRVALARALAPQPDLLMLDEPIGALDRTLRDRLIAQLQSLLKQVGVTVLYVTHDQDEAFAIADRVVLMNEGRIVQAGTPEEVYQRPASVWVARFLGMHNLLPAQRTGPRTVHTEIGTLTVDAREDGAPTVLIRPEGAECGREHADLYVHGTVAHTSFHGASTTLTVRLPSDRTLSFELPATVDLPSAGEPVSLGLRAEAVVHLWA